MSITRAKGAKGKCDVLFSKIIRKDGTCLRCGSTQNIQTSHIISRRYAATRTNLGNAQPLCAKCHFYFTHWPKEFSRWIEQTIGNKAYGELKRMAETPTKLDWQAEYERLKEIWDGIRKTD